MVSVSLTPLSFFRRFFAAAVRRSFTVSLPAPVALAEPVPTVTGLPLRPIALAGTVAATVTRPGPETVSGTSSPVALSFTVDARLVAGGAGCTGVPPPPPGAAPPPVVTGGAGGANVATFAPPIAPCDPVAEIVSGAEESEHTDSPAPVGPPATL